MEIKRILLARPHPLLVHGIFSVLERNGFHGSVPHSTDEIRRLSWEGVEGAIVSAAAASQMGAALPEVFEALHTAQPDLPIAITTLMEADYAAASLRKTLEAGWRQASIIMITSCREFEITRC